MRVIVLATLILTALFPASEAAPPTNGLVSASDEAVYLLKERNVKVRRDGEKTVVIHDRLKILKRNALEYAGDISIEYNAYYEKARLLRAFTTTADGKTVDVARNAIHDTMPASFANFNMYSDVRTISFSMPALDQGAIIEYEVEIAEHRTVMEDQVWDMHYLDDFHPVELSVYTIACPDSLPLNLSLTNTNGIPVEVVKEKGKITITARGIPKLETEAGMPPLADIRCGVQLTSIPSWEAIGTWFQDLAKGRDKVTPDIRTLAAKLTEGATNTDEKIRSIFLYMQKNIRYVGIELGRSAYQPHPVEECLRNQYGDCKDQALLMSTLLRQAGVPAYVALLRANYIGSLATNVPHPHQFNHAIVCVPGTNETLWLDSTAKYLDERSYPYALDGAQALVVEPGNPHFLTIPPLPPERAVTRLIYEGNVQFNGVCQVKQITEFVGRAGAGQRTLFESLSAEDRKEEVDGTVESMGGNARLISFTNSDPHDVSIPFRKCVEFETDSLLDPTLQGYSLTLPVSAVTWSIDISDDAGPDSPKKARKYDWTRRSGSGTELMFRLHVPKGFELSRDYQPFSRTLPQGVVKTFARSENGVVEAGIQVYAGAARIPAARWQSEKNKTDKVLAQIPPTVALVDNVEKALTDRDPGKAVGLLREWVAADPQNAELHHRLARVLHRCGLLVAARKEYAAAIRLQPNALAAYVDMAETFGGYGGLYGKGFRRDKVQAILEEAIGKAADKKIARLALAQSYERNDDGLIYGEGAPFEKALPIYDELLKEKEDDGRVLGQLGENRFAAGQYEEGEKAFTRAFEANKMNESAWIGRWICAALAGRIDEALEAIEGTMGSSMVQSRLAYRLISKRRYGEAAGILARVEEESSTGQRETRFSEYLERMDKFERRNYATWQDRSSASNCVITFIAAIAYGDEARQRACVSSRLQIPRNRWHLETRLFNRSSVESWGTRDVAVDLVAAAFEYTESPLEGGDIEARLSPSKGLMGNPMGRDAIFQLTRENDKWVLCGLDDFGGIVLWARMAKSCLDQGDVQKARQCVNEIMRSQQKPTLMPDAEPTVSPLRRIDEESFADEKTRVTALTGAALVAEGDAKDGIPYLQEALKATPDCLALRRLLAGAFLVQEDPAAALALLSAVEEKNGNDRESLKILTEAFLELERFDEAKTRWERLKKITPDDPMCALMGVDILRRQGDYEGALKQLKSVKSRVQAALVAPEEAMLNAYLGRVDELKYQKRDKGGFTMEEDRVRKALWAAFSLVDMPEKAAEQAECLLLMNPERPDAMMMLCTLAFMSGDVEEANDILDRAVGLPREVEETRMRVAEMAQVLGRYDQAQSIYTESDEWERPSEAVYAWLFTGVCRLHLGKKEAALEAFRKASEFQKTDLWPKPAVDYLCGTITLEDMLAKADKAVSTLERSRCQCEANYYAGIRLMSDGQTDKGLALLKKAIATKCVETMEYHLAIAVVRNGKL